MQVGSLLAQRYRIEHKLGEGGMGVVFKAHDTLLDRSVAIKALSSHTLTQDGFARLHREAQAAAKLTHPNIVAVHDVIEDGESRLIVMEYVAGETLRARIPIPWTQAVEITTQVCAALDYAHGQGVVHRDIKPENIMITPTGTAKVMDFGLARSEGRSRLTETGMIVGTVAYMAPEQALSGRVDARSDLYSLGAVLYEAITGKAPFQADDPISVISMHVNVPPVSPRFHTPDVPTALESVITRLLAKDPTERYASAGEVARVLQTALLSVESPEEVAIAPEVRAAPSALFDLMTRGRLIDRDEELGALKGALESMLSARGQVVLVDGEPGIGKTRLVEELLVYARLRGCLALVGRCYEQEVNVPYLPVSESLRMALQTIPDDRLNTAVGATAPEVVKLVPELSQRLPGLTPSPPLEPDQERLRLFHNVTVLLTSLAKTQPLVLLVDDLHWADAATLQFLRHLARVIRAERLLVVGTFRDVEVDRTHPLSSALTEMNRERLYRRVLVRGLTRDHVGAMIHSILQTAQPVSAEFRDLIYQETEGNPFFVEEVLKHLVEVGALYIEEGRWGRKPVGEIDVPRSVREVIGRRLEGLSERCLRVLSLAAVVGRRFQFEILQAVGELPEEDVLDALEEAMRAQLIREESAAGRVEYDFAHALIREVLYEQLSLRRRMTLHQKIGETLERQYADRIEDVVEDLAHHFTRAPHGAGLEKAIQYSAEAARKSMRLFAYEEAIKYYQNATELLEETRNERQLAETYMALGEPFVYLDRIAEATGAYEHALKFYERHGKPTDVARVQLMLGHALQRHKDYTGAILHLERALRELSPEQQPTEIIQAHLDLSRTKTFMGKIEEAQRHAEKALELARARGALSMQAAAHASLGLIAHDGKDFSRAMAHYAESVKLARDAPDPESYFTLARSLNNMALLQQERGEDAEALRLLLEALEAARRARNLGQISFLLQRLSFHHFQRGDWETAKRYALDKRQMQLSPFDVQEADIVLRRIDGDLEGGILLARDLLDRFRRTGELQGIWGYCSLLARAYLEVGRIDEAHQVAVEAAGLFERGHKNFSYTVAEALARSGDYDRCEEFCTRGEALFRASESLPLLAGVTFGRAVLALEREDPDGAIRLIGEGLPLARRFGLKVLQANVLVILDQAFVRRGHEGDRLQAQEALKECLSILEQMGDTWKIAQVRAELAALG